MKHTTIAAIFILVLGGGWYFLMHSKAEAPVTTPGEQAFVEQMSEDNVETVAENTPEEQGTEKTFTVSGTNFTYDVTEMSVSEGDTVTINFESEDGFHNWVVDEFDAATDKVNPGTPTSITFVADKAGTFEYYCSVGSHRANGMVGTLIVE